MNISIEDFGKSRKGEQVLNYIIDTGFYKIEVLNFGCTIKSLKYPDNLKYHMCSKSFFTSSIL